MSAETWAAPASERSHDHQAAQPPIAQLSPAGLTAPQAPQTPQAPRPQSCWLCGQTQMTYQLVPDGGDACADVRWYCRDTEACTERWVVTRKAGSYGRGPAVTRTPAGATGDR